MITFEPSIAREYDLSGISYQHIIGLVFSSAKIIRRYGQPHIASWDSESCLDDCILLLEKDAIANICAHY
jgi:hypothetical protein